MIDYREHVTVDADISLSGQVKSSLTGLPPFVVASSLLVSNLNADLLDGYHASDFAQKSTTLAGYGITDAYTKTESDNRYLVTQVQTGDWIIANSGNRTKIMSSSVSAPTATAYFGLLIPNTAGTHGVGLAFRNGRGYFQTTEVGVTGSWLEFATTTFVEGKGYIAGINSGMVTTALGYTPYNASNPNGYITSTALTGYVPNSTTISINGVTQDLSLNRSWTVTADLSNYYTQAQSNARYLTTNNAGAILSYITTDLDSVTASGMFFTNGGTNRPIAANGVVLTGNYNGNGQQTFFNHSNEDTYYYRRFAGNTFYTWYRVASREWVAAQNYITSLTNGQITTALGYTPYNASNPAGYVTSSALTGYVPVIRSVIAGTGLSGGGTLESTRTIAFDTTFGDNRYLVTQVQPSDWLIANSGNRTKIMASSVSAPTATAYFGLLIPNTAGTHGVGLAFRNGRGYFQTTEVGVTGSWLEFATTNFVEGKGYITGINSGMVTTALGYTPAWQGRNLAGINSIVGGGTIDVDRTFQLAGDQASPGNSRYYGTNSSGTKGWYDLPSGGGSGTVTQVGLLVPTGFTVTSTPVTTSGNLQFAFASGYSLPTTSKQSEWDGKIGGSGSTNRISMFTGGTSIGNSPIYHSGDNIGIGTSPSHKLHVAGNIYANGNITGQTISGTSLGSTGSCFANTGFSTSSSGGYYAGTGSRMSSAIAQFDSTSQALLIPRMSGTEINAISPVTAGMLVYSTSANALLVHNGIYWKQVYFL